MNDSNSPGRTRYGFSCDVMIQDSDGASDFERSPEWVNFLIDCGFLARTVQNDKARSVLVLLLPTRYLAAPFISLGVIVGSLKCTAEFLNWEQFLGLPQGTELFIKLSHKGKVRSLKGTADERGEIAQGVYRRITIANGPKVLRGSSDLVTQHSFGRLSISLTEHPKQKDRGSIIKAGTFLKGTSDLYRPNWLVSDQLEALVITNKAEWRRVTRAIRVGAMGNQVATDLADVLLASEDAERRASRISICSPGNRMDSTYSPVAILDGPRALWQWRNVTARNLIILLGRREFDEEVSGSVFDLTSTREDSLLPSEYAVLNDEVPSGVGMSIFSVPYD